MARLKVKQISDFTSAVNSLIGTSQVAVDDSIDSLESQLSEGLDSLGIIDSAVSNALATEISTTDTEVGSLEVIDSAISNALTALDTEVGNIDIASLEAIDSAVSNAVAGILQGADANTDNFSEVISYINSVDAASDLDLVAEMASVDTRFGGIDTKVGSLEVIDSAISNALATEISTTDGEITAINASIDSLELYNLVFEQGGTVGSTTQFTLSQPVKFGVNDDLLVFINGHNVHKNGAVEGATEGYETADGLTFDLISIGYDIDATDHVTVVGIRQ